MITFSLNIMFNAPFKLILSGATGSGKIEWLMRFLQNHIELIDSPLKKILYCHHKANDKILQLNGIEIFKGIPTQELLHSYEKPFVIILDDSILNVRNNFLDNLLKQKSEDVNISIILITSNLSNPTVALARTNSHYLVLMTAGK